jgi:hypothetical protein
MAAKPIVVPLGESDMTQARYVARQWIREAHVNGYRHRYLHPNDPDLTWRTTLLGVCGELALAKHLGIVYGYQGYDKSRYDVGGYEVRTTMRVDGCLITHPGDKPAPYVLAIAFPGTKYDWTVELRGWSWLDDANQPGHWRTDVRYPCYMTPQSVLQPMATLPTTTPRKAATWLSDLTITNQ